MVISFCFKECVLERFELFSRHKSKKNTQTFPTQLMFSKSSWCVGLRDIPNPILQKSLSSEKSKRMKHITYLKEHRYHNKTQPQINSLGDNKWRREEYDRFGRGLERFKPVECNKKGQTLSDLHVSCCPGGGLPDWC